MTLSTNPIMVPTQPRESLKQANWEGFKQALEHTPVIDLEGQPTHMINPHLDNWFADIQTARQAYIPRTTHKTIPYRKETHRLRLLKLQYKHLHELARTQGWDRRLCLRHTDILTEITDELKVNKKQHWENMARELCRNTKDPKRFWNEYRKLMGSNKNTVTFMYNSLRQKVETVEEMAELHREF